MHNVRWEHIINGRTNQYPFDARCLIWQYLLKAILQCSIDLIQSLWLRDFGRWVGFGRYGKHPAGPAGLPTKTRSAQRWEVPASEESSGPQNNQTIFAFFPFWHIFTDTLFTIRFAFCCPLNNLPYTSNLPVGLFISVNSGEALGPSDRFGGEASDGSNRQWHSGEGSGWTACMKQRSC